MDLFPQCAELCGRQRITVAAAGLGMPDTLILLGQDLLVGQRKDGLVKPGVNSKAKPEAGKAQ